MWLLFVPILVIVAVLFVLGSVLAGAAWLIGAGWPWLLIGLGVWLFWHEDGRHRAPRGRRDARRWPAAVSAAPSPSTGRGRSSEAVSTTRAAAQSELPIDVQVKVDQIRRKVDALLARADQFPPFSQDLYLVRQTASDYLPRTLGTYLALPKDRAETPLAEGGKTAHQELKAQLDLLDSKLDDIARDLKRQDADRLLANRRFLEARFGARDAQPSANQGVSAEVA